MDIAIAVVGGNKSYVYLFDYVTKSWKNLFSGNALCQIKVLQRGRNEFRIEVVQEGNPSNSKQYSLIETCEVTKVQGILQIPVKDPNPCMLGIKFRDENSETEFLLRVSTKLAGFSKPLRNQHAQPSPSVPSRVQQQTPMSNHGYNPPKLAPKIPQLQQLSTDDVHQPNNPLPQEKRRQEPAAISNYGGSGQSRTMMMGGPSYGGHGGGIDMVGSNNLGYSPPSDPSYRVGDQQHTNQPLRGNHGDFRNVDPYGNGHNDRYRDNYFEHQGGRGDRPMDRELQPQYRGRGDPHHYGGGGDQPQYRRGNDLSQQQPQYGGKGDLQYGGRDVPQPQYRGGGDLSQQQPQYGGRGDPPHPQDPHYYPHHREDIGQQQTPPTARKPYNQPQPPPVDNVTLSKMSDADFQADVNHYAQQLASTLSSCNRDQAVQLVKVLTSMMEEQREGCPTTLGVFSMSYEPEKEVHASDSKTFNLAFQVEIFEKESYQIYLSVLPTDTVEHLKLELQKKVKIPKECQTWIYGTQIVEDKQMLRDLDISDENDVVYVYVQHPKKVKGMATKTLDQLKEVGGVRGSLPHHQSVPMVPIEPAKDSPPIRRRDYALEPPMEMPNQNLPPQPSDDNIPQFLPQEIPSLPRPTNMVPQNDHVMNNEMAAVFRGEGNHGSIQTMIPPQGGIRVMPAEIPRGPQQDVPVEQLSPLASLPPPPPADPVPVIEPQPPTLAPGWECPSCTYRNLPYRPGCEICNQNRPEDYVPPRDYQLTEEEKKWADQTKQQDMLLQQMFQTEQEQKRQNAELNYNKYIETDDQALVTNTEVFDCPICICEIDPGDGIVLRGCLHQICKECLHESVTKSEHVQVKCPFTDGNYDCDENISDREIRAVLSDGELEALYNRGLRQAEAAARDSFHCQTMDCPGFCFYEDEVNEYKCVVCNKLNCILCKAQHENMNCQEYQDDLKRKADNDDAARQTQEMLEKLVTDGEAMHCPQCRVIVTKKIGCDWIKCTVCKTEMCWATKGPRWGPGGRGDTSGGCKCGVNRKRCHPNCRNCH